MKEIFLYAFRAICPILLTIALGYTVSRVGKWDDKFFAALNQLAFFVFLPANLFCSIYKIEDLGAMNWALMGYMVAGVFAFVGLGILAARFLVPRRDQKPVIVQAAFRSNQAVLGLPLAEALGGAEAMAFASLGVSICVPIYNVVGVLILTYYNAEAGHKVSARELLKKMATNPLILGCLAGLACVLGRPLLSGGGEPVFWIRDRLPSVYQLLNNLGRVVSTIMLFALGARLDLRATGRLLPQITLGVGLRLVGMPVLVIGGALLMKDALGVTALELPTMLAVTASPVAVSSAVMVEQMGGDRQLAGQLVMWSSVLSMATLFLLVVALKALGAM